MIKAMKSSPVVCRRIIRSLQEVNEKRKNNDWCEKKAK